ncbi:MAG: polymerase, partial [Phycisphaerales bacterium]|nr:polymerase [Phycisphaerales bacterium]
DGDDDGPPAVFAYRGEARRVTHCDGPERIAGVWWDGHDKTRDYYEVEDEAGRRFWIFRVVRTGRWFLHGEFG